MTATYIVEKYGINNLRIATKLDYTWELRFAVVKDKPLLASILNKVLATVNEEKREEINDKWIHLTMLPESNFFERNKGLIFLISFVILGVILFIVINIFLLRKQVKSKTYQLNNELIEKEKLLTLNKKNVEYLDSLFNISGMKFSSIDQLIDYSIKEAVILSGSRAGILYRIHNELETYELTNKFFVDDKLIANIENFNILDCENISKIISNEKDYLIINDVSNNKNLYFNKYLLENNVSNAMVLPVKNKNKCIGIFMLFDKKEDYKKSDTTEMLFLFNTIIKIVDKYKDEIDLREAKEKAEESNNLKTEFLHNMSHEIRTPMNAIMGFSELLVNEDIKLNDIKYYSRIINNSSEQLLRIIDDILDISRLETKKVKVIAKQFCLNDLIFQLYNVFEKKAKSTNIDLYIKMPLSDENCIIKTDQSKLQKILSNLIDNSIKYTKFGQVGFGYFIEQKNLILFVKDTGIGIEEEAKKYIFDRFRRIENDKTSLTRGLGLGLSIVKENVELLNGKLYFNSTLGEGTTFYVKFTTEQLDIKINENK